jgi:hypothetical protein
MSLLNSISVVTRKIALGIATISATAFSYFGNVEVKIPEPNVQSILNSEQNTQINNYAQDSIIEHTVAHSPVTDIVTTPFNSKPSVEFFWSKISIKIGTESANASSGNSFVTNGFALNGNFSGAWGWKHGSPLASQYRFNPLDPEQQFIA